MPAVAIVGAVGSIAAGASAIAAAGGLAAMGIGAAVAAGAAIAGGAITIAGVVTGNKKLMTLGSVLGVVGGVASWASKAGTAAATAGSAAADVATDVATNVGTDAATSAMQTADAARATADTLGTSGVSYSLADAMPNLAQSGAPTGIIEGAQAVGDSATAFNAADAANVSSGLTQKAAEQASAGLGAAAKGVSVPVSPTPPPSTTLGTFDGFGKKANDVWNFIKNKDNAELVKAGGGLIGGAMKAYEGYNARAAKAAEMQKAIDNYNQSIIGQRTLLAR